MRARVDSMRQEQHHHVAAALQIVEAGIGDVQALLSPARKPVPTMVEQLAAEAAEAVRQLGPDLPQTDYPDGAVLELADSGHL